MSRLNGRIAAVTVAAFVGVVPVITAGAAHADRKPPTDSTQSQYPGGCVDMRTGHDYPNSAYRTDASGTVWKCSNGKWYSTVRKAPSSTDGAGAGTLAPPRA